MLIYFPLKLQIAPQSARAIVLMSPISDILALRPLCQGSNKWLDEFIRPYNVLDPVVLTERSGGSRSRVSQEQSFHVLR